METRQLPIAVIGSGPVGLAIAAHLSERGQEGVVLEQAAAPAARVAEWGHVRLFSPWRLNVDDAASRLLGRRGWTPPEPDAHPTGSELRERYLLPLAELLDATGTQLALRARVLSVTRRGRDKTRDDREAAPFELAFERDGSRRSLLARAVVDASGAWGSPNPLGAGGVPAPGERALGERITYGIPDVLNGRRDRYAGRRTLVIGGGHSAMNVLGDLSLLAGEAPGTRIAWAIRRPAASVLGAGGQGDVLPQRAALVVRARELVESGIVELLDGVEIEALRDVGGSVLLAHNGGELGPFDEIVAATGVRPDLAPLRELRLELDPALEAPVNLAPLIDPRIHSCGTVPAHGALELAHPERDFYLAGMKSYGRAPTFLMLNGYGQARSIAAALAGEPQPTQPGMTAPTTDGRHGDQAAPVAASCCGPGCG